MALVHKSSERGVTRLLEFKVVSETCFNKCVDFLFEVEQLLSELLRSCQHFFILHNLETPRFNVAAHSVYNWDQSNFVSDEHFVHELKIFRALIIEHVLAARFFFHDLLSSESNQFLLETINQLWLSLRFQNLCVVLFLVGKASSAFCRYSGALQEATQSFAFASYSCLELCRN